MADEKSKIVTDATGPDAGPAPVQPEAGGGTPAPKQEQPAPEVVSPDKAPAPEQAAPAQTEKDADAPKEQKAASVSVFNFSEIMAEKKAAEKAATQQEAKTPDKVAPTSPSKEDGPKQEKSKEQEQAPKRRGRPPKADKDKAAAPAQKEAPGKKDKAVQKPAQPGKTEKAAPSAQKAEKAPKAPKPAKGAPEVKAPVHSETPAAPAEAPRPAKDEQIVYIKLSELHAFKNHPFQVRNDEEMKAMVSSVRDKGVTQPAIVRPREDGGYEIVSGHRRQKASELAGYADMPCIVRNLTDDEAITQMVEDNLNQREEILPSERAKALKMQLEAIKHQGSRTSGQIDPKDAGKRSNEIVAERNKMAVKQVQRYIRLNELVPDLMKLMDEKKLGFTTAVELSYIGKKNQNYIAVAIDSQQSSPSQAQAKRMRELDEKKLLNGDVIDGIMMEDKKEVDKVILTGAELSKYFGKETTPREMKDQIIKLLDDWKGQQKEHEKPEKKTEQEK